MRAISYRIARSPSVLAPSNPASGAALVSALPSSLEPQLVHGLARAKHWRHHRPISGPNALPAHPPGRYHSEVFRFVSVRGRAARDRSRQVSFRSTMAHHSAVQIPSAAAGVSFPLHRPTQSRTAALRRKVAPRTLWRREVGRAWGLPGGCHWGHWASGTRS
jgi:hypothetical protein